MMVTVERDIATGARWSNASRCTRMAALHLDGHVPAPEDPDMLGYMLRGKVWEDQIAKQIEQTYGVAPLREYAIQWDHGEMHADFVVFPGFAATPEPAAVIEHKSRTSLEAEDSDWLQLAGQMHYGDFSEGALWITHPVSGEQRRLPFELTPWWRARVMAVSMEIAERATKYPDRICKHPSEARSHFCRFPLPCFDSWVPPEPLQLDHAGRQMAREMYDLDQEIERTPAAAAKQLIERRDTIRNDLAPRLLNGADYHVTVPGSTIRVRRTESDDATTYDIKSALAAGAVTRDQLAPFAKTRKGSVRWTVTADGVPETDNGLDF